jgi:hypothetical protein
MDRRDGHLHRRSDHKSPLDALRLTSPGFVVWSVGCHLLGPAHTHLTCHFTDLVMHTSLNHPTVRFAALLAACACTTLASADATLTSPDGRWVATIEDVGGGAGQVTSMKDMSLAVGEQSFVANTVHFVRMGSPLLFDSMETTRMEDLFTCVRFVAEADNFTAVLVTENLSGTVAMVNGEMVSGSQGGLRVSITFMDAAPSASSILQTVVKPFVYANMNVDGQMLGNVGGWSPGSPNGHFWQHRPGSAANSERWFVGAGVDSVQTMNDSFMLNYLDNGAITLMNQVMTGPADLNSAMSWPEANINEDSHSVTFGLGNAGLFVSPTFGSVAESDLFIRSADSRWLAKVTNTNTSVGIFKEVLDQSQPAPGDRVANQITAHAFVGAPNSQTLYQLPSVLDRLHMWVPGSSRRVTEVGVMPTHPGVVVIFDGIMLDGEAGGAAGCMTWVDTAGQHPTVTPLMYADMDIDGNGFNEGGFETDHFWMTAPASPTGNVRWARSTAFESWMLDSLGTVFAEMLVNNSLPNTAEPGPTDLEWAFRYHSKQLESNVPYVYGFAVGNPNIEIPANFCQPTFSFPCPADVNGDGSVDAADLSILLGNWGPWQPTSPDTDFNNDNVTDAADLGVLLGGWGECG